MDTQFVRDRITQLRLKKGVSEYQMSYDLGHSRSYVYNISSGKSLPPMAEFLQICNYFDITPSQFFDESEENPALLQTAIEELRKLNDDDLMLIKRLEKVYPDEAAFFREYGVTTLLAAPFSKRINQGFIAVDDPTRYTDDPVFLFIASYAVVVELNEIKQQQSLLAATKASKYNPEDIHINFFGGMEIISSKGTLTGEDIKADQCYLLLAYLILNHKKNFSIDTLAEIICPYDELDSPYKVVNNIVYRLRRTLSVIGLDKLVIGKNGTFQINPNFNIHTDFDRFEDACIQLKTEENPDMRHSLYHSAVDMYKGQLLPRCEHELWLMQLSMYYQSLYLQITKGYVRLKMECKDYILAQKTAIDALRFDPKDSELNMYAILAMGFQGNLSMAQTYYTAAKPYLALEHAEVIKKYLHIK